ncbi:MAG: hemolysin III family protein [Actinomycetaceae bacterium]|nr:hemolysin III family protein [Actinomycetaceae bacterium]
MRKKPVSVATPPAANQTTARKVSRNSWRRIDPTLIEGLLRKPKLRGWFHTVAAPVSLTAVVVLIVLTPDMWGRFAAAIFLVASLMLFGISGYYHRNYWGPLAEKFLRNWDHSNIFLLIAGTYTPMAVGTISGIDCYILLGVVWAGAIVGIILQWVWPSVPRWLYTPIYVALGWVAIWYMPELVEGGGLAFTWLLISGGICYTLGALVYGFKWPNLAPRYFGFHELFHAFTLAGWICHCVAAYFALLQ